eukprot:TRINITY_DN6580_c0_g1_i1.p2 TRINITY_DN6580_c0_g1~~TRINITY_DN6580_c0_g1_i1.p2  ORF type:complete len:417 (+),score=146.73 TRINITY_DN6580_c0_g1_i1:88-1338(+)
MGGGLGRELGERALFHQNLEELQGYLSQLRMNAPDLVDLDLSNRFLGHEGAEHATVLTGCTHLRRLNLSYNRLEGPVIGMVTECLARNRSIRELNLSGNAIGETGAKLVADYLASGTKLEVLIMFNCSLDDYAALHLANALQLNTSLRTLRLDRNDFTDAAAEMLAKCLKHNRALAELSLTGNDRISAPHLAAIRQALEGNRAKQQSVAQQREGRSAKAQGRTDQLEEQRREAEVQQRREREDVAKQQAAVESRQREIDEEQVALEQERQDAHQRSATGRQLARSQKGEYVSTVVGNAYRWREQLSQAGEHEWNSGFVLKPKGPGDPYLPTRRLEACWCEPADAPGGYAGQLHYHCKFEPDMGDAWKTGADARHYEGCKPGKGCKDHQCVSVGAYAKPLERDTAATFFSSRSPIQA